MPVKPYTLSVKMVVRDDRGRCLLIRRSDLCKGNPGKWDLPGGKIDPGESFDAALAREVLEETGLTVRVDKVLGATESESPTKKVIYLVLGGRRKSGRVRLSSEHDGCVWVGRRELASVDLLEQFRPFVQAYIREETT